MVPDTFNILALCAGGGGLELGIELALPAARTICVVEREAFCCEILASAVDQGCMAPFACWTDAGTFDGRPWRGVVDCFAAGIPCQPHSTAGKCLGAGDERNLWPIAARIIRECESPFIFLENVGGAIAFFGEHVISGLEGMGYRVEAGLFSAAEIGTPHGRSRLFILAYTDGNRWGNRAISGNMGGPAEAQGCAGNQSAIPFESGGKNMANGSLFSPGPADLDAWRRVLEADPALEPALCGVADGLASRVDRLRMLGNGVVPLQAAYAFCTLLARLEHAMTGGPLLGVTE